MTNGKGPLVKFQAGAISCALWESDVNFNGQMKTMLKATIERRYKDSSGQWKSSNSFGRNDIPLVQWCLSQAFTTMIQKKSNGDRVEEEMVAGD